MSGSRSRRQPQRGFVRCNYDDLNSETFGDTGSTGDDWMAAHDAFVSARAADNKPASNNHEEEVLSDTLSQQMKIKDLWPTSPAQSSKLNDSIWSSPELPHRPPTTVIGSPALLTGHKVMRVEDLEQKYNTPPPPKTTPTNEPLGPPPGLRMPTQPLIRLPPHFLLGHPQLLPPGFLPFVRPHPQHLPGFPPPPGPSRSPLLPPSAFHRPPPPREPFPPQQLPQGDMAPRKSRRSEYLGEMKSDGSGFMTQREKEWVIKIQLIQLQSSDPTNEDYYYMNYVRRKQQRTSNQTSHTHNEQSDQSDEQQILALPNIVHSERKYRPAEFSGALGKLTVSSVGAPRKRIDVSVGGEPGKEVAKKKQALIVIEKLYSNVLNLEELESKASVAAEEDRGPMLASRDKTRSDMLTLMQLRPNAARTELALFYQVMMVRKGKRLINRLLPLLTDNQAKTVLVAILNNLPSIIKKDSSDQVLSDLNKSVSAVIATFDLPTINVCLHAVMDGLVKTAQSEFGAGLLNTLLVKGHTLAAGHHTEHIETWCTLSAELCQELLSHQDQLSPTKQSTAALLSTLNSL